MKARIIKGISSQQHQPVKPVNKFAEKIYNEKYRRDEAGGILPPGLRYFQENTYQDTPPPMVDPATGHEITAVTMVQPDGSLGYLRLGSGAFEQLSDLVSRMNLTVRNADEVAAALQAMPRTQRALREAVQRAGADHEAETVARMRQAIEGMEEAVSRNTTPCPPGRSLWRDNERAERLRREAVQNMTRISTPLPRLRQARTCQGCVNNRGTQGGQTFCGEKSRCVPNERCQSYRTNNHARSARRGQK